MMSKRAHTYANTYVVESYLGREICEVALALHCFDPIRPTDQLLR
jgi:hypothetical protein